MVGKLEELVTIWNIIPVRLASFWVSELRHTKSMDVFKSALDQIKLKQRSKGVRGFLEQCLIPGAGKVQIKPYTFYYVKSEHSKIRIYLSKDIL